MKTPWDRQVLYFVRSTFSGCSFSLNHLRIYSDHPCFHRSLMYVVDLTTAVYYQKCHDPDCGGAQIKLNCQKIFFWKNIYLQPLLNWTYHSTGYRSPLRPSPIDAIPNPRVSTDSEQISNGIESSNWCHLRACVSNSRAATFRMQGKQKSLNA